MERALPGSPFRSHGYVMLRGMKFVHTRAFQFAAHTYICLMTTSSGLVLNEYVALRFGSDHCRKYVCVSWPRVCACVCGPCIWVYYLIFACTYAQIILSYISPFFSPHVHILDSGARIVDATRTAYGVGQHPPAPPTERSVGEETARILNAKASRVRIPAGPPSLLGGIAFGRQLPNSGSPTAKGHHARRNRFGIDSWG